MVIVPPSPGGDRIAGSLGDDRAAVDGDAATISHIGIKPIPTLSTGSTIAFRHGKGFGTDNAAIDGDAAALPAVVDLTAVGGAKLNFFCTSHRWRSALSLPLGAEIAAVDDDRALAFAGYHRCLPLQRALLPMPAIPLSGHTGVMDHPVEVEIRREARRQPAHGALIGALA